jgi:conjugative transfer signal peptidase TraF
MSLRLTLSRLRRCRGLLLVFLAAFALIVVTSTVAHFFTWNLSPSLPRGLYRLDRTALPRLRDTVSFQPASDAVALIAARSYLPAGVSLLKVVIALPGDRVCINESSMTANGVLIGPISRHDSAGRALTPYLFCGVVPPGAAFVATRAPLSFDSRYFGPVSLTSLTVAVALWTY